MKFFTGLHQPSDAQHFDAAFISVNRLINRKGPFAVGDWIMDSGAFSHMLRDGEHMPIPDYVAQIKRWKSNGNLLAAITQDLMCEPFILEKTGLTIPDHQRLTIERYDALLRAETGVYIMPVLQGYEPLDYVTHIRMYGNRLAFGAWVGVGSVCKRNGDPRAIEEVLLAIHSERPDLRLHGFGLKSTALKSGIVDELLYSADSMAWSYQARMSGGNGNDWREAKKWTNRIVDRPIQRHLFL
jgi:hypothetical protein